MKKIAITLATVVSSALALVAHADNKQAQNCEIYVQSVQSAPNSHGSGSMGVIVKVGWLGNGEFIQKVGFYGHRQAEDLGNDQNYCHSSGYPADTGWEIQGAVTWGYTSTQLQPGEYYFTFPIRTGSVVNQCPGYHFANIGTFFVETSKNTYWVNPEMDSTKYFYFDANGFNSIEQKGGTYQPLSTARDDLRYYNALGCK